MNEEETKDLNSTEEYEGTLATAPDHEDTSETGEEHSNLTVEETDRAGANSFANMLVEAGMLSLQQLVISQETARRDKVSFVRILERDGLILSRDLAALRGKIWAPAPLPAAARSDAAKLRLEGVFAVLGHDFGTMAVGRCHPIFR